MVVVAVVVGWGVAEGSVDRVKIAISSNVYSVILLIIPEMRLDR